MTEKQDNTPCAIELRGITKAFGTVIANNNIDLTVKQGEIIALLGENGSGKTTLMNMLSGIYHPDSGSIFVHGKLSHIRSPKDAMELGIGMIHQHFKLVENLSAKDNIVMGTKFNLKGGNRALTKRVKEISERFGLEIDPDKMIYDMSVSERQTVEILKVLYRGAEILILDEPTAVLTPQETKRLFDIMRRMKNEGCAVIIITHKLNEVMEISDRVTILRKGESITTVDTKSSTPKELTDLMVGRPMDLSIRRKPPKSDETLLEIHHLFVKNSDGVYALKDVNFDLKKGEILGVAGIAGSGQRELCEAIAGLYKIEKGAVLYNMENIIGKMPDEIIDLGISMSFVPEDRLGMGLVASMGMTDNMLLKSYRSTSGMLIDRKPAKRLSKELVKKLEISTPNIETPVRRLSGGNVQKVLLGREIESNPNVLITAYPVRGLDINSSYTIYNLLNEQKQKGVGILYIGEDLDVLLELCDRIMVIFDGKIQKILSAKEATKEMLGLLMTGATDVLGGEANEK